jgi:hypothetical protein
VDQDKPEGVDETEGNPEREGPDSPSWKPTDEPDPNEEGTATGPPPESVPGDSGEVSTPRR